MAFLEWKEKMSVGLDALDNDHKKIIEMVNRLSDVMKVDGHDDRKSVSRVLDDLVSFCEYHFNTEERILKMCKYPELEEHKKLHDDLKGRVRRFQEDFLHAPDQFYTLDLYDFLSDWLMRHILRADMAYKPWVAGRGKKAPAPAPQAAPR